MSDLASTVDHFLHRHVPPGSRVAVGLSGGVDSVVLLDLLHGRPEIVLSAIHVHHGLSANADAWADFCARLCAVRGIPLSVCRVAVARDTALGLEAAARAARYAAYEALEVDFIALAQHADDQAETVLHQLLRGTGLKGLAGMGETRLLRPGLRLLRPLLAAARADIEAHARMRGLDWIEDESNEDTAYTRNFLRHDVVPGLAARFPHYRESLARAARHAAEAAEMTAALAALDLQWDGREAHAERLDALSLARQVNALYHWLQWCSAPGTPLPSRRQLETWAGQLFRPAPPGKPHHAGGHGFLIRRSRNRLQLTRK